MINPVLARLEVPDGVLLLYENMAIKDPDRTGNWRLLFRQDGGVFAARNTQLWITDSAQFKSDDPTLFWNTPFSNTPDRRLTEPQQAELLEAIRRADFASDRYYSSSPGQQGSSPSVERWTVRQGNELRTAIVESGAAPPPLVVLRRTIDRLVANAPKS